MQEILKYFPELSRTQIEQYEKLFELYVYWNERINLISRKDIDQLYTRHILHSLAIAKYTSFNPGSCILDVGTGGGFPGIPLAIMFPQSEFLLIDSIQKKIKVVQDIIEQINLKNSKALVTRAEEVNRKFDFVVSRAVAQLPVFYSWVKGNIISKNNHNIPNGIIYLKGGDLTEELGPFKNRIISRDISEYFTEDFFETKKVIHLFK